MHIERIKGACHCPTSEIFWERKEVFNLRGISCKSIFTTETEGDGKNNAPGYLSMLIFNLILKPRHDLQCSSQLMISDTTDIYHQILCKVLFKDVK